MLQAALEGSGYVAELQAENTVESAGRIENLDELIGSAQQFTRIDEFLEQVSLVADTDEIPEQAEDQVVLMTLHSAKGLEFPVVFLIGAEESVFPHVRALDNPDEMEEERRLAYVGITRARQRLFISHAWSRNLFGSTQYNPPSRFLDEIPAELVTSQGNVTGRSSYGRQSVRARDRYGAGRGGSERDGAVPPYRRHGGLDERGGAGDRSDAHRDRVVEAAIAAGRREPVEAADPTALGLRIGDDVEHPAFGEGVVLELRGRGTRPGGDGQLPRRGRQAPLAVVRPAAQARRVFPSMTSAALVVESLTGNTWKAAELVGDGLAQHGWSITGLSKVRQPDLASIQDADLVIIATWVHGLFVVGQTPWAASTIANLPTMRAKQAAVFCTFALNPGAAWPSSPRRSKRPAPACSGAWPSAAPSSRPTPRSSSPASSTPTRPPPRPWAPRPPPPPPSGRSGGSARPADLGAQADRDRLAGLDDRAQGRGRGPGRRRRLRGPRSR